MLSDQFLMVKLTFLVIFYKIFLIFVFPAMIGFLQGCLSGCWSGVRKNGAQGVTSRALKVLSVFRVVHGHDPQENLKNCVKKLMSWVILRIFFQSMTKKLVKLSTVIVRMSSGLFALLSCFCLGGTY